jgi:hypothetical protein
MMLDCYLPLLSVRVRSHVARLVNGSEGRPSPSAEPGHTRTCLAPGGTVRVVVPPGQRYLKIFAV